MKKLLVLTLLMLPMWANAGLMCDTRYQNNAVASTDCELGSTNNDSTAQVNTDLMFGFNDWTYAWRDEDGPPLPAGLTNWVLDADLLGGSFDITWASPPQGEVMFVLKDGQDDPDTYVGWLLDAGDFGLESYTYTSPFLNTTTGGLKEISHATFYYRNGGPTIQCVDCTNQVPEPATIPLLGFGLAGLLWARRRAYNQLT